MGGLVLLMLIGFLFALVAAFGGGDDLFAEPGLTGAGEAVIEGGGWLIPRYYRLLGRQRHPAFWGVLLGFLSGGLVLWALIST